MQQEDKPCCNEQSSLSCRKVHKNYNNAIIQSDHYFHHKKCIGTHNNTIHNNPSTYPYNPKPLPMYYNKYSSRYCSEVKIECVECGTYNNTVYSHCIL